MSDVWMELNECEMSQLKKKFRFADTNFSLSLSLSVSLVFIVLFFFSCFFPFTLIFRSL